MPKKIALAWVLLAAALGFAIGGTFVSWHSSEPAPRTHDSRQPAKTEDQDRRPGEGPTKPLADRHHQKGQGEQHWYDTFLDHTPDWFVAIFTALLSFVTYRLVTSTNRLWEAGERQIAVAEKSSAAAIQSVDAVERQLRAYMIVSRADIKDFGPDLAAEVRLDFKNTGATPALDLMIRAQIEMADASGASLSVERIPLTPSISIVGAQGANSIEMRLARVLTAEEVAVVIATRGAIFAFGSLTYFDVFRRQRRTTNFRLSYSGEVARSPVGKLSFCAEGNNAT